MWSIKYPLVRPELMIGAHFVPIAASLVEAAKETICIIVYDWRLYPTQSTHPVSVFTRALEDARKRGVQVRALVANDGVRDALVAMGFKAKRLHSERLLHVKMMLIDGRIAVVGSHNYTQSAFTSNMEVSVAVDLGTADNDLSQFFEHLWSV